MEIKYLIPPFDEAGALKKVQLAEDAWNSEDPEQIAMAYTKDTEWRNRSSFISGHDEMIAFLKVKWQQKLRYKLRKKLWAFNENRIAVRFEYEYHDTSGQWFSAYGNENRELDKQDLMKKRFASINDIAIMEADRRL